MPDTQTLFIYTETSTHAGTGSGLGAVDMPIQREKTTSYPIIQGSGVKGALRQQYNGSSKDKEIVFGPEEQPEYAGAAAFGDARLLAFPVRSAQGVMAWVTSVDLLGRFARDTNLKVPKLISSEPQAGEAFVSSQTVVAQGKVLLEEYLYKAVTNESAQKWAEWLANNALPQSDVYAQYYGQALRDRLIVLPKEDVRDFALYSTEVITRVRIDSSTKTVVDGALFTQELLPADTLLYVPVQAYQTRAIQYKGTSFDDENQRSAEAVLKWLEKNHPKRMQIGGDETVGHGFVALRWGGESS